MSNLASQCPKCQKTIAGSTRGSLTAWIFRQAECACESGQITKTTKSGLKTTRTLRKGGDESFIGQIIDDRFEILAHLGSGGMGSVYKALDSFTGATYALKIIAPELLEQKALAKRLEHEAQAAKALSHVNIVPVFDVGKITNGSPYLIMGYVDGESLEEILRTEVRLNRERALNIFIQVAEALVHAHDKGVVHRDLKPSNILVSKTPGGQDIVKIVDFGIAKITDEYHADKTQLTQTGELIGSPWYMSPEQCRGDDLDGRSDLYSFGCIMYEALSGKVPFDGENPVRILLKHISEPAPQLPKSLDVGSALRRTIMRCLEKDPHDRYPSAAPLLNDLSQIQRGKSIFLWRLRWNKRKFRKFAPIAATVALGASAVGYLIHASDEQRALTQPHVQHRVEQYNGLNLMQLTDAIEQHPNNAKLYYDRGVLHDLRDERTNAIDDYSQAIALKPAYLSAYIARSRMYMLLAKYGEALKDADKAIRLAPDNHRALMTRAYVFSAQERYLEAYNDCKHCITLASDEGAYCELGRIMIKLARYKEAESYLDQALKINEAQPFSRGLLGLMFIFKQTFPQGYEALHRSVSRPDVRGFEFGELAYYYFAIGNAPEAERAIAQMKAIETFPARAFRLVGEAYRAAGMEDKAIKELSASTSLEEYPPGYRQRAIAYVQLGQLQSAKADLEKSLKLNPYSPTTLSWLALVESRLGARAKAAEYIKKAVDPTNLPWPIVFANKAAVELDNGDAKAALDDANKALNADPWLKEGYQVRARVYERLKDAQAASADRAHAAKLMSHLDF
jgi:serine/threonine protein kinase